MFWAQPKKKPPRDFLEMALYEFHRFSLLNDKGLWIVVISLV
jgi:hypothetical protein